MFSTSTDLNQSSVSGVVPKILLFDLDFTGHHAGYIQHLVKYWCEQKLSGSLDVVVSPKFVELHFDVVNVASDYDQRNVNFVAISSEEEAILKSKKSSFDRAFRAFQEWNLLRKYASVLEATHCLVMYLDALQLPLALVKNYPVPCQVSISDLSFITETFPALLLRQESASGNYETNFFYLAFYAIRILRHCSASIRLSSIGLRNSSRR
jgi:hypothetical protein